MKKAIRWIGTILVVLCLVYFFDTFFSYLGKIPPGAYSGEMVARGLAGIVLILISGLLACFAAHLILRAIGVPSRFSITLAIIFVSQFAKFLPGNVAQYIGRTALGVRYGYSPVLMGFSVGYEILWSLVAGALIGLLSLLLAGPTIIEAIPALPNAGVIGVALPTMFLLPILCTRLLNSWRPAPLRWLLGKDRIALPAPGIATACLVIYVACLILAGIMFLLVLDGIVPVAPEYWFLVIAVFTVAWLAGFLLPGAPAGLGVREAILLAALSPAFGPGPVAAAALLQRLVNVLADGIMFAAGWVIRRYTTPEDIARDKPRGV